MAVGAGAAAAGPVRVKLRALTRRADDLVGCKLTVSKPVLKAPMVSALETRKS